MADTDVQQSSAKKGEKSQEVPEKVTRRNPAKGKSPVEKKTDNDSVILQCLQDIQKRQKEYDSKVDSILSRVKKVEETQSYYDDNNNNYHYDEGYEYFESAEVECEEGEIEHDGPSSPKKAKTDSRFAGMAKRFKGKDVTDPPIDVTLADNINDLFRKGMDNEQYEQMIKEDTISRPENCESLVTVKCNKIIWDLCSQSVKYMDKRMQNSETSLIKGSILLAKAVNRLAEVETEAKEKGVDLSSVIDQCNDSLSLLGHCNRQICMTRREVIKPELKSEYSHLCNSSVPFSTELFGDDVSKTAKELEDSAKMGQQE